MIFQSQNDVSRLCVILNISMFKMTRQMTGARNVSGHVRAKYQVKSKEEFQVPAEGGEQ